MTRKRWSHLFSLLFLLHLPWLSQTFLEKGITTFPLNPSGQPIPIMTAQPDRPAQVVLCSHGTNSHKEVFFFPARVLSWRGILVISNDATALSTDAGLSERVNDLSAIASWVADHSSRNRLPLNLVGHSDGCPPSVRALNKHPETFSGKFAALGSFLDESPPLNTPLLGLSGGFDQIFPPAEMKSDVLRPDHLQADFVVSWLSDHFTEQYDPFLLARLGDFFLGTPDPGLPILFAGLILLVATIGGICLVTGSIGAKTRSPWVFAASLFFGWLPLVIASPGILIRGWVTCFFLGMAIPAFWRTTPGKLLPGFVLAMEVNIILSSRFFWENLGEGISGILPFLFWYPVAWTAKTVLFFSWLAGKTSLSGFPLVPLGICAIAILRGSGFAQRATAALRGKKCQPEETVSPVTALSLLGIAFSLWIIRFFQGMMQPEILLAVLGNYSRTLLLPTLFILPRLLGTRKKPFRETMAPPSSGDKP
jgi:pimeloyl-ACP methyl ester carboxylesterase